MRAARLFRASATSGLTIKLLIVSLLLLAATSVAHAQEPVKSSAATTATTTAPTGYGTITGRLTSDDGRPLSNVTVFLSALGNTVPSPPRAGATDASGRFEFRNLPSGAYIIQTSVPGYVRLRGADEEGEPRERTYYRIGDSVNLTMTRGGAITGTVTDAAGRPLVAIRVRALRVRDASGKPLRANTLTRETQTDDRGVYRAWGLEPGSYLVSAGNNSQFFDLQLSASEDTPTYYPSATRDGATEVSVRYGEEQSGIDIRFRNERGRRVSGTLSGAIESGGNYGDINVSLIHTASGLTDEISYVRGGESSSFSFSSVADGEYDLIARRGFGQDSAASEPLHIKVRGADITGLQLVLAPLGTISGRLSMEAPATAPPAPGCQEKPKGPPARQGALEETVIVARVADRSQERLRSTRPRNSDAQPRSDGEFLLGSLQPGRYRLDARLPDERWYVRAITTASRTGASRSARSANTAARPQGSSAAGAASSAPRAASAGSALSSDGSIVIGQGTQATGIRITLASGAAKLAGRVLPGVEGAALPSRLRLYVVPREPERADDLLRFAETDIRRDGTFTLANLAPGRYWLLARPAPAPDPEANETAPPLPLAWNTEARADLRRQSEAARQEVELQPCQQMTDVTVRYAPPGK
jgi:Carboxypeptidase regulatory-like domain